MCANGLAKFGYSKSCGLHVFNFLPSVISLYFLADRNGHQSSRLMALYFVVFGLNSSLPIKIYIYTYLN